MTNNVQTRPWHTSSSPQVGRLGFDDGWYILSATFLNLRQPSLLVDTQIVGPGNELGLEPFGSRNPTRPLPHAAAHVELIGDGVAIRTCQDDDLLAAHWFKLPPPALHSAKSAKTLTLIVGDTHAIQLSWSALWTCDIGVSLSCSY